MRKILFVIPDADPSGAATQLALIAAGLPSGAFDVRVCVLGGEGPATRTLRDAGIAVEALGWTRLVDLKWLRRLRAVLRGFHPHIIHAFRLPASRAVLLAGGGDARLIVSGAVAWKERGNRLSRLDCWLLGRADQVVAAGFAEASRYQTLGLPAGRIAVIPPAVSSVNVPDGTVRRAERVILGTGPLRAEKGFIDAVWAMGILRFLPTDPHLVLIGRGPDRARLEHFARVTQVAGRIHFLGEQADVAPLLARTDVVWVPSRAPSGRNAVLEAMAAGRPVVAARLPDLAELVVEGETGFLVDRGDKVALARRTRLLLDDPGLCARLGEAGRRRAAQHFAAAEVTRRWQALYEGRASVPHAA